MSDEREPLTDEQLPVNAAALAAYLKMIKPDDDEMRGICDSLVERGSLAAVYEREGDGEPEVVGYLASEQLRAAMEQRAAMN